VTRCDWNLNVYRAALAPKKLEAAGWVRAGSVGRVASHLVKTGGSREPLAVYSGTGDTTAHIGAQWMGPEHYAKVWWVRRWVLPLISVSRWPMRMRVAITVELSGRPELHPMIEAVYRFGGEDAVAALEGNAFPKRCRVDGVCLLALGHSGDHKLF